MQFGATMDRRVNEVRRAVEFWLNAKINIEMWIHWYTFSRYGVNPWWRHQMETFSALLAICAGNSPVPDEFPAQRPVTRSFDVFFDLRLNKQLRKQSWDWWFETQSCSLWRHRNAGLIGLLVKRQVAEEYHILCFIICHFSRYCQRVSFTERNRTQDSDSGLRILYSI